MRSIPQTRRASHGTAAPASAAQATQHGDLIAW